MIAATLSTEGSPTWSPMGRGDGMGSKSFMLVALPRVIVSTHRLDVRSKSFEKGQGGIEPRLESCLDLPDRRD